MTPRKVLCLQPMGRHAELPAAISDAGWEMHAATDASMARQLNDKHNFRVGLVHLDRYDEEVSAYSEASEESDDDLVEESPSRVPPDTDKGSAEEIVEADEPEVPALRVPGRPTSQALQAVLKEIREDLSDEAAGRLEQFLSGNRSFTSPNLEFKARQLEREASLRTTLYSQLANRLAEARLEEKRNTPALIAISPPLEPARPEGAGVLALMILGGFFGAAGAAVLTVWTRRPNSDSL